MKKIIILTRIFICLLICIVSVTNLTAQSLILRPNGLESNQSNSQSNLLFTGTSDPFILGIKNSPNNQSNLLNIIGRGRYGTIFPTNGIRISFTASEAWTNTGNGVNIIFSTLGNSCLTCESFFNIKNTGQVNVDFNFSDNNSAFSVLRSYADINPLPYTSLALSRRTINYLQIASPDNTGSGIMFGKPGLGTFSGGINYTPGLDLQFRTANNVRLTVAQTGNIGIGTLTPSATLDVAGTYGFSGRGTITGTQNNLDVSNQSVIYVNGATSTLSGILGGVDGRILHIVVEDNTDLTILTQSTNSAIGNRIYTGQSSNLLITDGGGLTLIYDAGNFIWRVIDARP